MARGSPGRTLPYRHRLPSAYGQNKLLTSPVLQRFPKDDDDEAGDTDRAPFLPSPSPSRRARYRPSPSGSGSRSGALDAPTNFLIASLTSKRCQPFLVLLAFSALTTLAGVVSLLEHRSGLSALGPSPLSAPDLVREPPLPEELHHPPATHTFVRPPRNQQRTLPPIQAHAPLLKADCLEQWIAQGTLCDGLGFAPENGGTGTRIDGVWSWVNGSDPRHRAARRLYGAKPHGWWDGTPPLPIAPHTPEAASARATLGRRAQTTTQNTENRFRDNNELLYSMRSAVSHINGLEQLHIISPDFDAPAPSDAPAANANVHAHTLALSPRASPLPPEPTGPTGPVDEVIRLPSERSEGQATDSYVAEMGRGRMGQIPTWLDPDLGPDMVAVGEDARRETGNSPKLRVHHDWNVFHPNWLLAPHVPTNDSALLTWKRDVLPTFNSLSIEGMMGLQPGLSENFVYNNDDFFINSNLSTSDFVSPIFGTVLRFQPELRVTSIEFPGDQPGEWPALKYSNWLLSRRFGERARAYITHVTRSMSKPLLLEARLIWAEEFASNALHRFRGQGRDAATHFLAHHLIIERHREALLWSFFVLRLDTDGDGLYDPAELRNAWIEMGVGPWARNRKVDVGMPIRATLGPESASNSLRRVGFPVPLGTSYEFTSHDGYPFLQLSPAVHRPRPPPGGMRGGGPIRPAAQHENWPSFVPNNETEYRFGNAKYPACKMDLNACLYGMEMEAQEGVNAEEVFQTFAFGNVQCGDCLILHLVGKSGTRGLSAFLPSAGRLFPSEHGISPPETESRGVPHLPLSKEWGRPADRPSPGPRPAGAPTAPASGGQHQSENEDRDEEVGYLPRFSLRQVARATGWEGGEMRDFATRLIQRYTYSIGESSTKFSQLLGKTTSMHTLDALRRTKYAFVCLNDDITGDREEIVANLQDWFSTAFPTPLPFEKFDKQGQEQQNGRQNTTSLR